LKISPFFLPLPDVQFCGAMPLLERRQHASHHADNVLLGFWPEKILLAAPSFVCLFLAAYG